MSVSNGGSYSVGSMEPVFPNWFASSVSDLSYLCYLDDDFGYDIDR